MESLAAWPTGWLRTLVNLYATPLALSLALLLLGVARLWLPKRGGRRRGRALVSLGAAGLVLFSLAPVPLRLLGSLQDDYAPYRAEGGVEPSWIVVLCGGARDPGGGPALSGLTTHSRDRLAEGLRVARLHPEARVLTTGAPLPGHPSCARTLGDAAVELGLERDRLTIGGTARNTEEEARVIRERLGGARFVLVTSSWHLPRAMAVMRGAGLEPIAAPAGTAAADAPGWIPLPPVPDGENLVASELWIHEVLGRLWAGLRGRTTPPR